MLAPYWSNIFQLSILDPLLVWVASHAMRRADMFKSRQHQFCKQDRPGYSAMPALSWTLLWPGPVRGETDPAWMRLESGQLESTTTPWKGRAAGTKP